MLKELKVKPESKGFTLIEILLVLVLLSVTAVAVIATIPPSSSDQSKQYARSFYQRLQLLNEEAVLSGLDFGIRINEEKSNYLLMTLASDGWQETDFDKIPSSTLLPSGVTLSLILGNEVWGGDDRLFEPGSLFDEEMFAEFEEEKPLPPPQIFVLSSAELTPFTVSFYPNTGDAIRDSWRVKVNESGVIKLFAPGEVEDEE